MPTIPINQTSTEAFSINSDQANLCIEFPAQMTGTVLALHGTIDGTNYRAMYSEGVAITVPVVASTIHTISAVKTYGIKSFKLVSNASEVAARTLLVSVGRVA